MYINFLKTNAVRKTDFINLLADFVTKYFFNLNPTKIFISDKIFVLPPYLYNIRSNLKMLNEDH